MYNDNAQPTDGDMNDSSIPQIPRSSQPEQAANVPATGLPNAYGEAVDLLNWARWYYQMGFNVIPTAGDKRPVETNASKGWRLKWKPWAVRRQSPKDLERLPWRLAEGMAAVCGSISGGLICVDFDQQPDAEALTEFFSLLDLPSDYPWLVKTPGHGWHVWLRIPALTEGDQGVWDRPGIHGGHIELRSNEHYTVLPPSLHPSGGRYQFVNEVPSAPPNDITLSDLLTAYDLITQIEQQPATTEITPKASPKGMSQEPHRAYGEAALEREMDTLRHTAEGTRNAQLNQSAFALGQLVGAGVLERFEVEQALIGAALETGLSQAEVMATLKSGLESGIAHPRDIHETSATRPHRSQSPAAGEESDVVPGEQKHPVLDLTQGEEEIEKKPKSPTDDELGDMLIQGWNGDYAYFQESWHRYEAGFWLPENRMERWTWDIMKDLKYRGVKPNKSRARSVEDYLRSHLRVENDMVDSGDCYINLPDGLYNLDTGTLEPHQRELYQTSQMGFNFDPTAQCPTWLQSLNQWLVDENGQPDTSLIALLQEAFGYSLTTDTSLEAAFWLCGPAGSGKSTVLKVLSALAGNAQASLDLSVLEKNTYQLADIVGKRVVTCTEARAGSTLVDNVLKQFISGEEMVVRQVYGKTIRFIPKAKIWWAMNERPANRDSSNAVYRRLKLIQFPKAISGGHQDRKLFQKLEAELPGIFNWAMEGLQRLRQKGNFTPSARADQELEAYKRENDVEAAFISDPEWCLLDPQYQTSGNDLYLAYKLWGERYGHFPVKSSTKVARDWERLGFKKSKNGSISYHGIGLTPHAAQEVKFKK